MPILSAVGRWSFSIYLLHWVVGERVYAAPPLFGWEPAGWEKGLVLLAAVGLSVVVGRLFYRTIEAPVARLAGRITYR
jgi:peptidoglycan/LPS O-acetylase OafA/YrhL